MQGSLGEESVEERGGSKSVIEECDRSIYVARDYLLSTETDGVIWPSQGQRDNVGEERIGEKKND